MGCISALPPISYQTKNLSLSLESSRLKEKEIVLARLRIGQTKLTHYNIIENLPPPTCQYCPGNIRYTIQHFLLECPTHNHKRQHINHYIQTKSLPSNLSTLLGDDNPELLSLLFDFLRSITAIKVNMTGMILHNLANVQINPLKTPPISRIHYYWS